MQVPKNILYCTGRKNNEEMCFNCERYIKIHDFRGQLYSIMNIYKIKNIEKGILCKDFMKREY